MRYFAVISYDGTDFLGWQKQVEGDQSIQYAIERALSLLLRENIGIVGCGRTDTGVHARGYHLHFDTLQEINEEDLTFRLNRMLPESIAIHEVFKVKPDVHARFDAIQRSYCFRIKTVPNPFENRFCYHYPYAGGLDLQKLNQGAEILLKYNDFFTFCKSRTDVKTTLCKITRSEWVYDEENQIYSYFITSDRFLRGMIRLIVGMCLNVSRGNLNLEDVIVALDNKERLLRTWSVEGKGLLLFGIKYPENIKI